MGVNQLWNKMDLIYSIPRNPAIAVGLPVTCGMAMGLVTRNSVNTWYSTVRKPTGEPPRLAFPIVWTLLYAGMGWASHIFVKTLENSPSLATRELARTALHLHWAQFALNLCWTPLFFGLQKTQLALVDILLLTGTVYKLTSVAAKIDDRAFYIHLAYSAWLTWATYLNS